MKDLLGVPDHAQKVTGKNYLVGEEKENSQVFTVLSQTQPELLAFTFIKPCSPLSSFPFVFLPATL